MNGTEPALIAMRPLQRSMVLASLRAPRDGVYLLQDVCELAGAFDLNLLRCAWQAVVDRHPALRCAVCLDDGNPLGFRLDSADAGYWQEEDYSSLASSLRQGRLESLLREDRERGFDFARGAPLRIIAARTSGDSVTLIWTIHHALVDGRSMTAVWQKWLAFYNALRQGRELPGLAPASESARGLCPSTDGNPSAEDFWRDSLRGLSQTTDYIADRVRDAAEPSDGPTGRERVILTEGLTLRLRDLAVANGATLNNIVQGAWALLLSRYSGRTDVVFGVTRAGRGSSLEEAGRVGFYINTLPLRIKVEPKVSVGSLLKEVRTRWQALRSVEHTPLHQIAKWTELPLGMPLFESVLNYEHEPPGETLARAGGHWSGVKFRRFQRTDSSLTLAATGSPSLTLELIFDSGRFSRRTMAAAAAHLKQLLESFASQAEAPLSSLKMLSGEERRLLPGAAERSSLSNLCMHQVFEEQVERTPSHTAIDTGDCCISYRELNRRSNHLARRLREARVGPGHLVAVGMESCPESVIAILAILKAGGAFLPIDHHLPQQRIASMVEDAGPRLVLYRRGGEKAIAAFSCEALGVDAWNAAPPPEECGNLSPVVTPEDLAYTIYTSGSSGQPKAVAMHHRGLVNHALAASEAYGICEKDRRLQMAAIGTDVFIAEVFNYLSRGAALVYGWDRRNRSVREFLQLLEDRHITIAGMPSAWWSEWMAAAEESDAAVPRCLRAVIIGMEKADPASYSIWKNQTSRWRKVAGSAPRLFNAYGPTETGPTATVYETGSSKWESEVFVPIGKPLAHTAVRVLDENGSPVPIGVQGELYIGGASVAREYWKRPALTAERFVPDPFDSDARRIYRTGDIVFALPDGNLVFVGRADRQVKIRGFRVELDEIEAVLAAHSDVKQCAVVLAGEGDRQTLGAFLAFHNGAGAVPEALRSWLAKRLPEHMIPEAYVTLAALPTTANGKIDRQTLPLQKLERTRPERCLSSPFTATEQRLVRIWQDVLNLVPTDVTDNFFELGADSLDATRLITLVEAQFGVELPASVLWQSPTLGRMASALEERSFLAVGEGESAVVALQTQGSRIPIFCFPGADDDPGTFLQLALHLGKQQPFYVVRDPRPLSERGAYTVEQAAGRLVSALRQVRKTGPYVVCGHCYGGLVAFEAARLLVQMGETVGKVVMIEVPAPGYPKVLRHWRNYLRLTIPILRGERPVTLADARQHLDVVSKLARKKAASWARRARRRAPAKAMAAHFENRMPPALHPNAEAGRNYVPRRWTCDLVQVIAAGERHSTVILDDPRLGWRELTGGTFTVAETPGPADAIFKLPHVRGLAAQIESLLERSNAGMSPAAAGLEPATKADNWSANARTWS